MKRKTSSLSSVVTPSFVTFLERPSSVRWKSLDFQNRFTEFFEWRNNITDGELDLRDLTVKLLITPIVEETIKIKALSQSHTPPVLSIQMGVS